MRYIPLFEEILDSSMWEEPDIVLRVWITMLLLMDGDSVVRRSEFSIAKRAGRSQEEVREALKVLESPDSRRSDPQLHDGRRIERVEDGWFILNAEKYQDWMAKRNRQWYQKKWAADKRERAKGIGVPFRLKPDAKVRAYEARLDCGDEAGADALTEPKCGV